MSPNQRYKLVRKHELLNSLHKEDIKSLLSVIQSKSFSKGDVVFDRNSQPSCFFMLEEGLLNIRRLDNTTQNIEVGEFFGEIGFINEDFRSGSVVAVKDSTVGYLSREKLFDKNLVRPQAALLIIQYLARKITSYLRSNEQLSTEEIISQGESQSLEFKSTLRWNLFTNKKDMRIENASLKTIAAFLNTHGGILIIGVDDEGKVMGLETDQFPNMDKLLLHLSMLIKKRIGIIANSYISPSIEKVRGINILRIDCNPSLQPVYFNDGKQDYLFVRTGPSSTSIAVSNIYDYIQDRFYSRRPAYSNS